MWYVREATEEEIENQEDILGYKFSLDEESDYRIEGIDPANNVRKAFIPHRKDAYWVSLDLQGEELRIATNLYREPSWIEAFNNNEDLHGKVAKMVFGEENYNKEKRDIAKTVNFGKLYGMSHYSMKERFPHLSLEFCEQFMKDYERTLPYIFGGQERDIRRARKEGTIYSVLGRPRRVSYYMNHPDRRKRGFGIRTIKNSVIQGTAADLLRLMFVKIWKALFEEGKYDTRWRTTVHDEINWSVPREEMEEVLPILIKCMTVNIPGWPVTLTCGLEVGTSWGEMFPFNYDLEKGIYTPDWIEINEDEEEEIEEDLVDHSGFWSEEEPF